MWETWEKALSVSLRIIPPLCPAAAFDSRWPHRIWSSRRHVQHTGDHMTSSGLQDPSYLTRQKKDQKYRMMRMTTKKAPGKSEDMRWRDFSQTLCLDHVFKDWPVPFHLLLFKKVKQNPERSAKQTAPEPVANMSSEWNKSAWNTFIW